MKSYFLKHIFIKIKQTFVFQVKEHDSNFQLRNYFSDKLINFLYIILFSDPKFRNKIVIYSLKFCDKWQMMKQILIAI